VKYSRSEADEEDAVEKGEEGERAKMMVFGGRGGKAVGYERVEGELEKGKERKTFRRTSRPMLVSPLRSTSHSTKHFQSSPSPSNSRSFPFPSLDSERCSRTNTFALTRVSRSPPQNAHRSASSQAAVGGYAAGRRKSLRSMKKEGFVAEKEGGETKKGCGGMAVEVGVEEKAKEEEVGRKGEEAVRFRSIVFRGEPNEAVESTELAESLRRILFPFGRRGGTETMLAPRFLRSRTGEDARAANSSSAGISSRETKLSRRRRRSASSRRCFSR
jgi:hypothetical protein